MGCSHILVDSGQRKLYKTTLIDLNVDVGQLPLAAPEQGLCTPSYYHQQKFTTWFKLGAIDLAPEESLRELVYFSVPDDDLVQVEDALFIGHRIDGIAQLLEFGNVTYWLASPAPSDTALARGPGKRQPAPVIAPRHILTGERRILHISDLHVAPGFHAFELDRADAFNKTLAAALHAALQDLLPGMVVVTGDLTWSGAKSEFERAYKCLDALRSSIGLTHDEFVIIPGNHDVRWTDEQRDKDEYQHGGRVTVAASQAENNYREFFRTWYGRPANPHISVGRRFLLLGGPSVDVLGLNSNVLQQIKGAFGGVGCVTREALERSAREMGWTKGDERETRSTDLRVLALHHHVVPVVMQERPQDAQRGFGVALDAGEILQLASSFGIDLILHGHQHQPFIGTTWCESLAGVHVNATQPLLVAGCGSTGVVNEHLGPIQQRCFNLITLGRQHVTIDLYATPQEQRTFERVSSARAEWGAAWRRSDP